MTTRASGPDLTPALVQRLRRGDRAAGEALGELFRPALVRFARGYLDSQEQAERVAGGALEQELDAAHVSDDVRAALYRAARARCLAWLRQRPQRRAVRTSGRGIDVPASRTGDPARLRREVQRQQLGRALEELPSSHREALRLRHVERLTRAEVAAVLELPLARVTALLCEGLRKLREHAARLATSRQYAMRP